MMTRENILQWLREENPERLQSLFDDADRVRRENVGEAVHLRGLVEISNHCVRQCGYCGLRSGNKALRRYRMTADEILTSAHQAVQFGYGTVVLQAGEDFALRLEWVADVVRRIKAETALAVTLSLGERSERTLKAWKDAGADRYLLRFETSDRKLFNSIHPGLGGQEVDRIKILRVLRRLGYEVGSGIMVGIPGQSYSSVADDLLLFRELDLDMIGIGPFIAHPSTPLGAASTALQLSNDQVPSTEHMVYKVVALARLLRPDANIPSTSALATINKRDGREKGLQRGANVVMPNLTPLQYRKLYEIYPAKACVDEKGEACHECLGLRIARIGRRLATGKGGRARRPEPQAEMVV